MSTSSANRMSANVTTASDAGQLAWPGQPEPVQDEDPQQLGSYQIVGRLGSGGMGRVFLGRSPGGRLVAVKVIRPDLAGEPDFRLRFTREINAARKVSGLFTAPVVDADTSAPQPWLATAYVPGPTLRDAVAAWGPLPAATVLDLAAGLAEGLAAIHAAGLVHRDLKPSNVLLSPDGPRVIDFGICRAAEDSPLTRTGLAAGSPGFMSPEHAEGREVTPAGDIFSLGAVLAYAATGDGPFGTGTTATMLYRIVHAEPTLDRLPDALRPLITACLAKDPARRPAPAQILAGLAAPDTTPRSPGESAPAPATPAGPPTMTALTAVRHRSPRPEAGPAIPPAAQAAAMTRRRWPVAALAAACGAAIVAGIWLAGTASHPASRHHPAAPSAAAAAATPPGTASATAAPSPAATPTTGMLTADKLQAGDCLRGSNLELNIQSAAWPQYAQAVPCNQAHTAEVIYAGYAWPAAEPFPGTQTIDAQSAAKCEAAFREYVGLPQAHSAYSLINLAPADTSSWQSGDRSLQCVAWQATTAAPAGAPLYGSIWGTHR